MSWLSKYLRSTIGLKQVMGLTGLGLVLFIIIHMLGNLQVFIGQDTFNEYPIKLRNLGALLWLLRAGLLAAFAIHVVAGLVLWRRAKAARPVPYRRYRPRSATFYGRYMALLGIVVLAFVGYHLAHFTFRAVLPQFAHMTDSAGRHDLYGYVVDSFQIPWVALSYIVANLALVLHMLHGLPSLFQSAGLRHPKYNATIDRVSLLIVAAILVGNTAIPLAILLGVIP